VFDRLEARQTPTYCPPEQIQNAGSVDEKADVYSLGCILYECASGAPPFEAVSVMEMMAKQLFVKPRRLTELTAHIGMDLADLVDQMLSKQPTERPNMEQIRATILEVKETCAEKTQMLDASYLPGSPAPILPHDLSLMDFRLNSPRETRTSKELIAAMVDKVAPKWRKLHRHAVVGVALGMMMLLGVSVAHPAQCGDGGSASRDPAAAHSQAHCLSHRGFARFGQRAHREGRRAGVSYRLCMRDRRTRHRQSSSPVPPATSIRSSRLERNAKPAFSCP
jgi:hypothetical protein